MVQASDQTIINGLVNAITVFNKPQIQIKIKYIKDLLDAERKPKEGWTHQNFSEILQALNEIRACMDACRKEVQNTFDVASDEKVKGSLLYFRKILDDDLEKIGRIILWFTYTTAKLRKGEIAAVSEEGRPGVESQFNELSKDIADTYNLKDLFAGSLSPELKKEFLEKLEESE